MDLGRDRALLSALLAQVAHTLTQSEIPKDEKGKEKEDPFSRPLVVQLNEGDCGNATSALKALIAGFLAQFEETDPEVCCLDFIFAIGAYWGGLKGVG